MTSALSCGTWSVFRGCHEDGDLVLTGSGEGGDFTSRARNSAYVQGQGFVALLGGVIWILRRVGSEVVDGAERLGFGSGHD